MAESGVIMPVADTKKYLQEANKTYDNRKTWEELYGNISLQEQQAVSNLDYDYSKAVSEAYASSLKQNAAIAGSNLGQGFKAEAIATNEALLEQAYENYKQNYYSNLQKVESTYDAARSNVTNALETEATNYSLFADTPYQYLQNLFSKYEEGEFTDSELTLLKDYMKDDKLMSWNDISTSGKFFNNGYITPEGSSFYDKIMNYASTVGKFEGTSFNEWLQNENRDLYDWANSYNPYDYNPYSTYKINEETGKLELSDVQNKHIGSFKTMVGMTSSDNLYDYMDYFAGINKETIEKKFNDFTEQINQMVDDLSTKDVKNFANSTKDIYSNIMSFAKELGIQEEIEKYVDETFGSQEGMFEQLYDKLNTDMFAPDGVVGISTGAGAFVGAAGVIAPFAAAGSAVPVVGTIVGAIVGAIAFGLVSGGISNSQNKKAEEFNKQELKQYYNDILASMTQEALRIKRDRELEYYRKNK